MFWTTLISNPLTKYIAIALIIATSSSYATYNYVSRGYELKLLEKEKQLVDASLAVEKEKSKRQEGIIVDVTKVISELNSDIGKAKDHASKLKNSLKGVVITSPDCKPTKEFIELWNSSGKQ